MKSSQRKLTRSLRHEQKRQFWPKYRYGSIAWFSPGNPVGYFFIKSMLWGGNKHKQSFVLMHEKFSTQTYKVITSWAKAAFLASSALYNIANHIMFISTLLLTDGRKPGMHDLSTLVMPISHSILLLLLVDLSTTCWMHFKIELCWACPCRKINYSLKRRCAVTNWILFRRRKKYSIGMTRCATVNWLKSARPWTLLTLSGAPSLNFF